MGLRGIDDPVVIVIHLLKLPTDPINLMLTALDATVDLVTITDRQSLQLGKLCLPPVKRARISV